MDPTNVPSGSGQPDAASGRFFTAESANEALVLVRKVVEDAVGTYQELMRLRTERQELAFTPGAEQQLEGLRLRIEQLVERLKRLHEELTGVGCQLKDSPRGLIDFPAWFEGRKVLLCWQLGEPEVAYWHELSAGFAGRRPIDAPFRCRTRQPLPAATGSTRPG